MRSRLRWLGRARRSILQGRSTAISTAQNAELPPAVKPGAFSQRRPPQLAASFISPICGYCPNSEPVGNLRLSQICHRKTPRLARGSGRRRTDGGSAIADRCRSRDEMISRWQIRFSVLTNDERTSRLGHVGENIAARIGIGGSLAAPPLPHHRTYGSVYGGSLV